MEALYSHGILGKVWQKECIIHCHQLRVQRREYFRRPMILYEFVGWQPKKCGVDMIESGYGQNVEEELDV